MAILGFIVALLFSLAIMLGGAAVFLAASAFSGEKPWPALIPFTIGCYLLYLTCQHSPFQIIIQ